MSFVAQVHWYVMERRVQHYRVKADNDQPPCHGAS